MNINIYLTKQYGPQPCWELVADVMASERAAVPVDYRTVNRSIRQMAGAFRLALHKSAHGFVQVVGPVDFAIVLLGKTAELGVHHCGVCYDGKVLHALPGLTVYEDLSVICDTFELVEFWAKP